MFQKNDKGEFRIISMYDNNGDIPNVDTLKGIMELGAICRRIKDQLVKEEGLVFHQDRYAFRNGLVIYKKRNN